MQNWFYCSRGRRKNLQKATYQRPKVSESCENASNRSQGAAKGCIYASHSGGLGLSLSIEKETMFRDNIAQYRVVQYSKAY